MEWLKRIKHRGKDPAKAQGGSTRHDRVSVSANSSQANIARPSEHSSTHPRTADRVQSDPAPIVAGNNSGPKAGEDILQSAPGEQAANSTKDSVTSCSLWDTAYSDLKNDTESEKRIDAYERLLHEELKSQENAPGGPNERENVGEATDQLRQYDTDAGQKKLAEITKLGLKYMKEKKISARLFGHEIVLQDVVEKVAKAVEWGEHYIKDAVKDLPYASIVMVGVSLVLPLLKNPTAVEMANQDGFAYVTSQMRYYVAMERLLLPDAMGAQPKDDLTERLKDLYKLIIDFQVRSILRFYRGRVVNFFRGTIDYDSWTKKLDDIKSEQAALSKKFGLAIFGSSLEQTTNVARNTKELVDISRKQEQRQLDAENQKYLGYLKATDPSLDKRRIEETKGGLLQDSYRWVLDNCDFMEWRVCKQGQLLWIRGDPGKGKTMLVCGIINELTKSRLTEQLLSYFFCQATNSHLNNASAVLRGLIYMLVEQQPALVSHLQKKCSSAGEKLFEGVNAWAAVSEILANILQDPNLQNTYLMIDALDECGTTETSQSNDDQLKLLNFIVHNSALPRVRWIVSSRNWPIIEGKLDMAKHKVELRLELNQDFISDAVSKYIKWKVDQLEREKRYTKDIQVAVESHLSSNAHHTFLWVALVCQELSKTSLLQTRSKLEAFPPGLNQLYRRMMCQISDSEDAVLCKRILAVATAVYQPITLDELRCLVNIPNDFSEDQSLIQIVGLCGSFLTLRERTISFVHQSAKDYLVEHASGEIFPNGHTEEQRRIVSRSIKAMKALQRDIYGLQHLGYSINKVEHPKSDPLASIRYACVYWVDHLCEIESSHDEVGLYDNGTIDAFLRKHFLHWLEALSLINGISDGVLAIAKLISLLTAYSSALLFSPVHSLTRELFQDEEPDWITTKPAMEADWGACIQTLYSHSQGVRSVAFSHDGTQVVSGSDDNTVKIWDASSSACLKTLEGHSGEVRSVAFLHDGTQVVSGSGDNTVKIWDASSSTCLKTLEGHSGEVNSVAFLHDGTQVVSGSGDNTVKIWDASSSACLKTLEGHSGWVSSVAFLHDGTQVVSGSGDNTVKIWDASSSTCLKTLEGHRRGVNSVAFSHNGTQVVSGSGDNTVKIWDASSSTCLKTLEGHSGGVRSVAFLHDGTQVVSGSDDNTVKIWDASSSACLKTLKGHRQWVSSVAFSHNGTQVVSGSDDNTVKIWDASSSACLKTLNVGQIVRIVAFGTTSSYLLTNTGTTSWDISSNSNTALAATALEEPRYHGYGINANQAWITWNGQDVLWLPSEYRPSCSAVASSTIVIGCPSGRVLIINFLFNKSPLNCS